MRTPPLPMTARALVFLIGGTLLALHLAACTRDVVTSEVIVYQPSHEEQVLELTKAQVKSECRYLSVAALMDRGNLKGSADERQSIAVELAKTYVRDAYPNYRYSGYLIEPCAVSLRQVAAAVAARHREATRQVNQQAEQARAARQQANERGQLVSQTTTRFGTVEMYQKCHQRRHTVCVHSTWRTFVNGELQSTSVQDYR